MNWSVIYTKVRELRFAIESNLHVIEALKLTETNHQSLIRATLAMVNI